MTIMIREKMEDNVDECVHTEKKGYGTRISKNACFYRRSCCCCFCNQNDIYYFQCKQSYPLTVCLASKYATKNYFVILYFLIPYRIAFITIQNYNL